MVDQLDVICLDFQTFDKVSPQGFLGKPITQMTYLQNHKQSISQIFMSCLYLAILKSGCWTSQILTQTTSSFLFLSLFGEKKKRGQSFYNMITDSLHLGRMVKNNQQKRIQRTLHFNKEYPYSFICGSTVEAMDTSCSSKR